MSTWEDLRWGGGDLRAEVAGFDAALPVERAHQPPASWYRDPRFHDLDRRAVFGRSWLPVARVAEVAEPGAYVSGCVAGIPWLVVRGSDGRLRAFHNSCRHKGREVMVGRGVTADALVCGYHAWTYDLDGRLRSAPRVAGIQDFDRAALSLRPLAVETWGPWIFVHVDPGATPLAPRLAELGARLEARGLAGFRYLESTEWIIESNWKVVVDNYLDGGYHVPHMHPSLAAQIDMESYGTELFDGYSIQGAAPAGGAHARIGSGALYAWIYPAFMINLYGRCIDTNTVIPLGPERCKIVYDFYFADSTAEAQASIAQSAITQREDREICESVQVGLGSPAFAEGRYAPRLEAGEHAFHGMLAEAYRAAI